MDRIESLGDSVWECKHHVAFIAKCRPTALYVQPRPHLREVFRRLAEPKESRVLEAGLARVCQSEGRCTDAAAFHARLTCTGRLGI